MGAVEIQSARGSASNWYIKLAFRSAGYLVILRRPPNQIQM